MKSHIKPLLLIVLMQMLSMSAFASVQLVIYKKGVTEPVYSILMSEKPQISFTTEGITFTTAKSSVTLLDLTYSEAGKIQIEDRDADPISPSGIESATSPHVAEISMTFISNDYVVFEGVNEDDQVTVVGVDGKVCHAVIDKNNNCSTVYLTSLPKGIYIVRVGKKSFKIFKKV